MSETTRSFNVFSNFSQQAKQNKRALEQLHGAETLQLLDQWRRPDNCSLISKQCIILVICISRFNSSGTACPPVFGRVFIWTCHTPQTNYSPVLTFETPVLMIHTLTNAATIPLCAGCDFALFMLEKTWTDYPSLDLWVVQRHTGAALELHNEALWRQRQASLAAPHPGYLISERRPTAAVARSRDSPQDQRGKCQTPEWSLGRWRNHRAVSKCRVGDAGGDGGPPITRLTLRV